MEMVKILDDLRAIGIAHWATETVPEGTVWMEARDGERVFLSPDGQIWVEARA